MLLVPFSLMHEWLHTGWPDYEMRPLKLNVLEKYYKMYWYNVLHCQMAGLGTGPELGTLESELAGKLVVGGIIQP